MAESTPNLSLPYILAAQAQKHVTHNEAIRALDAIVQLSVADRDLTAPPPSPEEGIRYIVGLGATGVWAGHEDEIAAFQDGAWMFHAPRAGWLAWVVDDAVLLAWDGSAWQIAGGEPVNPAQLIGVATTADATNRLAVASPASLFTHDGSGHQLKINKASASDTASVLFQTGYQGRAEMGLAGDDDYRFKVSPDGMTWHEAIVIDASDGSVTFPNSTIGSGIAVDDEGSGVVAPASRLNFTGAGVTVTAGASGTATVTIPGSGGTGNVPAGGSAGQVLAKVSGADHDTAWTQPAAGGVTSVNGQTGAIVVSAPDGLDVQRVSGSKLLAMVDQNDRALLAFEADGALETPALTTGLLTADALALADTATEHVFGIGFAVAHANDRVALYILDDGTVSLPGAGLSPARVASDGVSVTDIPVNSAADYNVHLNSGQSLAAAGNSSTIVYAANDFDFHSGAGAMSALNNTGAYGVGLAATEQVKFVLKGDAALNLLASPRFVPDTHVQVYSSNASSGVQISQMQPGASPDRFAGHMSALDGIVAAAVAAGKTAQVPYVTWIQGESDATTAVATYKAALVALKNNYNTQALTRTKQANRFPMIYTQLAGSNDGGVPKVGRAQWEAWQEDAELVLACPLYPFAYTDALHLTEAGYRWLGQMLGKVCHLVGYMGRAWQPLHPVSAKLMAGNVVLVKLHVPRPPLVLDTTTIAAATNFGFRAFDAAGEIAVSSVSLVNADTVRVQLAATPGASPVLEYAWRDDPVDGGSGNYSGNGLHAIRGNLRDSDASVGVYGGAFPLWNWCVRFSKEITV